MVCAGDGKAREEEAGIETAAGKLTPHMKNQQFCLVVFPDFGNKTRPLRPSDTPFWPRIECTVTQAWSFCK